MLIFGIFTLIIGVSFVANLRRFNANFVADFSEAKNPLVLIFRVFACLGQNPGSH